MDERLKIFRIIALVIGGILAFALVYMQTEIRVLQMQSELLWGDEVMRLRYDEGKVAKLNLQVSLVEIKTSKIQYTFKIATNTKIILADDSSGTISDLKEGTQIRFAYSKSYSGDWFLRIARVR